MFCRFIPMKTGMHVRHFYPWITALLLLILLCWSVRLSGQETKPAKQIFPQDLASFVELAQGDWMDEGSFYLPMGSPGFYLWMSPVMIEGEEIKLVVGDYCLPGVAQYLHFRFEEGALHYAGASLDGCYFRSRDELPH